MKNSDLEFVVIKPLLAISLPLEWRSAFTSSILTDSFTSLSFIHLHSCLHSCRPYPGLLSKPLCARRAFVAWASVWCNQTVQFSLQIVGLGFERCLENAFGTPKKRLQDTSLIGLLHQAHQDTRVHGFLPQRCILFLDLWLNYLKKNCFFSTLLGSSTSKIWLQVLFACF
jgi:hypothetical protein